MAKRRPKARPEARRVAGVVSGQRARQRAGITVWSHSIGAIPLLTKVMQRMQLEEAFRTHVPDSDRRARPATAQVLMLLVCNLLVSREPMYGVSEWASRYAPDLFKFEGDDLERLNDDRVGRSLERLFASLDSDLVMAVVRRVVREFDVSLDELHNDSTTVTFTGAYPEAREEHTILKRLIPAITWGHNKDHRPDLKQLLYTLTVTDDGGIPIFFQALSGNVTDDKTHQATWQLLRELVGRPDFLYVADCKLATTDNMNAIARQGGRFMTILPATRKENTQFRQRLRQQPDSVRWQELYQRQDEDHQEVDTLSVCADELWSAEGYRLHWILSTRKKQQDGMTRGSVTERALRKLLELRERLLKPHTRYRQRERVEQAVQEILQEYGVQDWLLVTIHETEKETFQQEHRGRPGKDTKFTRTVTKQYTISWQVDLMAIEEAAKDDGVFPLITNLCDWTAGQILAAYKRQPIIEKRFSQLKSDFCVAPVYLKNTQRIVGLLAVYFFALMVQALLERELRQAMQHQKLTTLPLYPEGRPCSRPTTRKVIDLFENVQRHTVQHADDLQETIVTDLSPLQRDLLKLLRVVPKNYGSKAT